MRYQLPDHWTVRYDYHEHPRGISAVVTDGYGVIRGVGVSKFSPEDPQFKASTGKSIALGRALARVERGIGAVRVIGPGRLSAAELERFGASLKADLLGPLVPTD